MDPFLPVSQDKFTALYWYALTQIILR